MTEKTELTEAQLEELRRIDEAEKEKKNKKKSSEDDDEDDDEHHDGEHHDDDDEHHDDEHHDDDDDDDDEKKTKKNNKKSSKESVEAPQTFDALVESEMAKVRAARLNEDAENEHSDKEYYIYKDGKPVDDHDNKFESPAQAAEKASEKDMGDDYYIVEYDTAKEEITDTLDIEGK